MFSDRNYPPSFLSGNRSLRDMLKDPNEYDRRMDTMSKRYDYYCKPRCGWEGG